MSVAFRRESDDEHLEPKFEIPLPPGPNLVTQIGLVQINARVAGLVAKLADLTDEAAITAARRDLRYWQTRQITAELAPVPDGSTVEFGTRVSFLLKGKPRTLTLVGHDEANPAGGMIAFSAPLARAMMGAEAGDVLEFAGQEDAIAVQSIIVA